MNKKIVKKLIETKHNDFLDSIDDSVIKDLINKNSIISGGAIASMLLNEHVKDFDYYFTDKSTCKIVAEYFVKKFNDLHPEYEKGNEKIQAPIVIDEENCIKIVVKSAGVVSENEASGYDYFEGGSDEVATEYIESVMGEEVNPQEIVQKEIEEADELDSKHLEEKKKESGKKYRPVFLSSNAITLSNRVQLVIRFFGSPEEIHSNFDFIHCTNYWRSDTKELVLNQNALESLMCKHLFYMGSKYPICSVIRTRKFLKKGWHINAGQYLKMCFQISNLNLKDISVLEDQLTGVDTAYFTQLIGFCKTEQNKNPEFKIDSPYIVSLVDKLF